MIGLAILIILLAPSGIGGYVAELGNHSLFPSGCRAIDKEKP